MSNAVVSGDMDPISRSLRINTEGLARDEWSEASEISQGFGVQ